MDILDAVTVLAALIPLRVRLQHKHNKLHYYTYLYYYGIIYCVMALNSDKYYEIMISHNLNNSTYAMRSWSSFDCGSETTIHTACSSVSLKQWQHSCVKSSVIALVFSFCDLQFYSLLKKRKFAWSHWFASFSCFCLKLHVIIIPNYLSKTRKYVKKSDDNNSVTVHKIIQFFTKSMCMVY